MIDVRGLTKRYGNTTAVQDLTFTVRPGLVTGFLGPNGAGKSTTMRMILGLDRPTSGSVTVNGSSVGNMPLLPDSGIGYMLIQVPNGGFSLGAGTCAAGSRAGAPDRA